MKETTMTTLAYRHSFARREGGRRVAALSLPADTRTPNQRARGQRRSGLGLTLSLVLLSASAAQTATQAALPDLSMYGGTVNGATVMQSAQAMSQSMLDVARQNGASPQELTQLEGQLGQMTQQVQQAVATGQVTTPGPDALASMGLSGGQMGAQSVGGMQATGMQGLQIIGGGGLDSLLSFLNLLAGFVPGLGPIVQAISSTFASILDTVNSVTGILGIFNQVQAMYEQLMQFADINNLKSLLTSAGGDFLKSKIASSIPALNVELPDIAGLLGLKDIQAYADKVKNLNLSQLFNLNGRLTTDTMQAITGFSKYGSPQAAMGTVTAMVGNAGATATENAAIDNAAQSAEALATSQKLSEGRQKSATATVQQSAALNGKLLTTITEIGVMRQVAATLAENNNIQAMNGSAISQQLTALVKATDANTTAVNQIVSDTIQRRRMEAERANQQNDYLTTKTEEAAQRNAMAVTVAPALAKATSIEGEDLSLPKPYGQDDPIYGQTP